MKSDYEIRVIFDGLQKRIADINYLLKMLPLKGSSEKISAEVFYRKLRTSPQDRMIHRREFVNRDGFKLIRRVPAVSADKFEETLVDLIDILKRQIIHVVDLRSNQSSLFHRNLRQNAKSIAETAASIYNLVVQNAKLIDNASEERFGSSPTRRIPRRYETTRLSSAILNDAESIANYAQRLEEMVRDEPQNLKSTIERRIPPQRPALYKFHDTNGVVDIRAPQSISPSISAQIFESLQRQWQILRDECRYSAQVDVFFISAVDNLLTNYTGDAKKFQPIKCYFDSLQVKALLGKMRCEGSDSIFLKLSACLLAQEKLFGQFQEFNEFIQQQKLLSGPDDNDRERTRVLISNIEQQNLAVGEVITTDAKDALANAKSLVAEPGLDQEMKTHSAQETAENFIKTVATAAIKETEIEVKKIGQELRDDARNAARGQLTGWFRSGSGWLLDYAAKSDMPWLSEIAKFLNNPPT